MKRTIAVALIIVTQLLLLNIEAQECKEPNYDDELIVELYLKDYLLSDGVITYKNKNNKVLYPLNEIFEYLDIKFTSDDYTFKSNVFDKQQIIYIDYNDNIAEINGTRYTKKDFDNLVSDQKIICYDDILYAEDDILEKLFYSRFDFSQTYLRTKIKSKRLFPIDIRKIKYELDNNRNKSINYKYMSWSEKLIKRYQSNNDKIDIIDNYEYLSFYLLSLKFRADSNDRTSAIIKTNMRLFDHDINLMMSRKTTKNKKEYAYNIIGKKTITNETIQPFLSKYEFGDKRTKRLEEIIDGYRGKGISITNRNIYNTNDNIIDLSGILEEGWFVELYLNNKLESYSETNKYNKYLFENIELKNGKNEIKYIFYGPLGEIEEKIENYYVNETYINHNKFWYDVEYIEDDIKHRYDVFHSTMSYGVSKQAIATLQFWNANFYSNDNNVSTNKLVSYELKIRPSSAIKIDLKHIEHIDNKANKANLIHLDLHPFKKIPRVDINYNTYSKDFSKVETSNINKKYDAEISTNIPIPYTSKSISISKKRKKEKNIIKNTDRYSFSTRLIKNTNLRLSYIYSDFIDEKRYRAVFSHRKKGTSHIITLDAQKNKKYNGMKNISYNNTIKINKRLKSISRINYRNNYGDYALSTSLSYINKSFISSINFKRNEKGENYIGVSFETKILNYNKSIYDIKMIKNANLYKGIAIVDVFLVDDKNKIVKRIDNTIVNINNRSLALDDELYQRTDSNSTIIPNLKTYKKVIVEIKESSLSDISWKIITKPKELTFYPGKVEHFVFYVKQTGEIDGAIFYNDKKGDTNPLKNTTVYLKDILYQTVDTTFTEDDGYYLFQQVMPGEYFIDIGRKDKKKLNLEDMDELKNIKIDQNQMFYFDQDIIYETK